MAPDFEFLSDEREFHERGSSCLERLEFLFLRRCIDVNLLRATSSEKTELSFPPQST